jgi:hypothetical protein
VNGDDHRRCGSGSRAACAAVLGSIAATAGAIAALVASAPATALAPSSSSNRFTGRIVSASGAFAGARGMVGIQLFPTRTSTGSARTMTLVITPLPCSGSGRCLRLRGQATGTMSVIGMPIPDAGVRLRLKAAGTVMPLGRVSVAGTVHGTGFIARGYEFLRLSLTSLRKGVITLEASSALVPGFTAP